MRNFKTKLAETAAAIALIAAPVSMALTTQAHAAFGNITAVGVDDLLGDSTAKTGIYELQATAEAGGLVLVLLTMTIVGILFVRGLISKGKRAG